MHGARLARRATPKVRGAEGTRQTIGPTVTAKTHTYTVLALPLNTSKQYFPKKPLT